MTRTRDDVFGSFYEWMRRSAIPRPVISYQQHNRHLTIAWPDLKLGIGMDGDDISAFQATGWTVIPLSVGALDAAGAFLETCDDLAIEHEIRARTAKATLTTSSTEDILAKAFAKLGLPESDPNYQVFDDDGQLVTTPDFVWEEPKIAVFVDGYRWHGGKDIDDILNALKTSTRQARRVKEQSKDKATRDAAARRILTARGFAVFTVTDTELEQLGRADLVAGQVKTRLEAHWATPQTQHTSTTVSIPQVSDVTHEF